MRRCPPRAEAWQAGIDTQKSTACTIRTTTKATRHPTLPTTRGSARPRQTLRIGDDFCETPACKGAVAESDCGGSFWQEFLSFFFFFFFFFFFCCADQVRIATADLVYRCSPVRTRRWSRPAGTISRYPPRGPKQPDQGRRRAIKWLKRNRAGEGQKKMLTLMGSWDHQETNRNNTQAKTQNATETPFPAPPPSPRSSSRWITPHGKAKA